MYQTLYLCIKVELQTSPQIFKLGFVMKIRLVHSYVPWFI